MSGEKDSEGLQNELQDWVRKEIGPIAKPDIIQIAPGAASYACGHDPSREWRC